MLIITSIRHRVIRARTLMLAIRTLDRLEEEGIKKEVEMEKRADHSTDDASCRATCAWARESLSPVSLAAPRGRVPGNGAAAVRAGPPAFGFFLIKSLSWPTCWARCAACQARRGRTGHALGA